MTIRYVVQSIYEGRTEMRHVEYERESTARKDFAKQCDPTKNTWALLFLANDQMQTLDEWVVE